MMIELLAGPLLGETTSLESKEADDGHGPPLGGQLIIAMFPDRFSSQGDQSWVQRAEKFLAHLEATEGVRMPGARRHAARRQGAQRRVRKALLADIRALLH